MARAGVNGIVVLAGLPGLRDPRPMFTHLERGERHDVACSLPLKPVSPERARLVAKGTVFTQGRSLRLAVPGMVAWIGDQDPG